MDTGFNYEKILELRKLNSSKINRCIEVDCKRKGICSFGCFAAGVALSIKAGNTEPRCNGREDSHRTLFEYNNKIIETLFFNTENLPMFRTALAISADQKASFVLQRVFTLEDKVDKVMKDIGTLLALLEGQGT